MPVPSDADPALVRYVSPGGDDDNSGTEANPWATLQHATDAAEPGMTVVLAAGVYAGVTMTRSGTEAEPIQFVAAEDAVPVVEEPGRSFLIHLEGVTDILISGVEVRGATEQEGAGVMVGPDSARITLQHSRIVDNRSFGILIVDSQDVAVRSNDISGSGSGVRTRGDVAGTLIVGNDIHDNDIMVVNDPEPNNDTGGQAIALSLSSGPITIRNNRIWGNRAESMDYGTDGSAVEVFGASDILVSENVMWDNETVMETGTNPEGGCVNVTFVRNVAFGGATWGESKGILLRCARDSLFAHNTLYGLDEWAFQFRNNADSRFGGSIENLRVVNNIVSGEIAFYLQDPLPSSAVVDHNLVDADEGVLARVVDEIVTSLAELRERTGLQASGRHAPLHLVDPAAQDFHLREGSPAINAGAVLDGINDDYAGAAPDVGRYEAR